MKTPKISDFFEPEKKRVFYVQVAVPEDLFGEVKELMKKSTQKVNWQKLLIASIKAYRAEQTKK